MNNFQTVIGIEVHAVVNSKTKMFSASKSSHTDPVNQNINEIDLGLPGALPSVNEEVVRKAICLAQALHMNIADTISFDRKNYFYRDLPKGYQITQQFNPIGTNGYIEIEVNGKKKKINIERIHMEEDTAKQLKSGNKVLLDYNRSGMPLIEIVSKPDMNSAQEAMAYLTELKRILNFCGEISDAKLDEGSMRADINISINPYGSDKYGVRAEIKNLNSIANVGKAIAFEQQRHASIILSGKELKPETRRFDDVKGETIYMRDKTAAVDYHFMPEPNILSFELDNSFKQEALSQVKYSLQQIKDNLATLNLNEKMINQLLDDYPLYKACEKVLNAVGKVDLVVTWILVELVGLLKKDNKTIESVDEDKLNKIIKMIKILIDGKINAKQGKTIIVEIYKNNTDPEIVIEKLGFKQITDESVIRQMLSDLIAKNANIVQQYPTRPERVEKMILGLLMRDTKGQANPVISARILKDLLNKK
ncbi:MAG: Asp-tRNA(Asn)/Glu-tRNA(Gln) amidotransferase subunit GatB [Mycoplasmoidaceae bacterium]